MTSINAPDVAGIFSNDVRLTIFKAIPYGVHSSKVGQPNFPNRF